MTDNTPKIKRDAHVAAVDAPKVAAAQKRLNSLHRRLGNWRAVGKWCGVNHKYVYDLALLAVVPGNPDIRKKLYLPRVMPSERKPAKRAVREVPRIGEVGWEGYYFRKVKR